MKQVLITGATGFIGRQLVNAVLERNIGVYVLTRDAEKVGMWVRARVTARIADLRKAESLSGVCEGIDTVFHLASYGDDSVRDEKEDFHWRITVDGTRRLLDEAGRCGVKRFVFVSSVKAMGEGSESCMDEKNSAAPLSSYGRAKLEAERLVLEAGTVQGMDVCNLRLPPVYGRDNRGNLWRMIVAIDKGRFPPLPEVGNRRSLVHIDDVVQALLLAADHPAARGQTYIVTDCRDNSTFQIYAAVCRALQRTVPRWRVPIGLLRLAAKIGDVVGKMRGRSFFFNSEVLYKLTESAWYSSRKIETDLGYRPTRFLEEGLREMVDEYKRTAKP